jgi:hypothetical protein
MERAWETAKLPLKSMLMYAFMLYMTPNTPSLVPLSITIYTIFTPLRAIFTVNSGHWFTSILSSKIINRSSFSIQFSHSENPKLL